MASDLHGIVFLSLSQWDWHSGGLFSALGSHMSILIPTKDNICELLLQYLHVRKVELFILVLLVSNIPVETLRKKEYMYTILVNTWNLIFIEEAGLFGIFALPRLFKVLCSIENKLQK